MFQINVKNEWTYFESSDNIKLLNSYYTYVINNKIDIALYLRSRLFIVDFINMYVTRKDNNKKYKIRIDNIKLDFNINCSKCDKNFYILNKIDNMFSTISMCNECSNISKNDDYINKYNPMHISKSLTLYQK